MSLFTHGWLVEITCVGAWRRVAVIDPVTGDEAVVHGPLEASEESLFALARKRLERRRPPPKRPDGGGFFA